MTADTFERASVALLFTCVAILCIAGCAHFLAAALLDLRVVVRKWGRK